MRTFHIGGAASRAAAESSIQVKNKERHQAQQREVGCELQR